MTHPCHLDDMRVPLGIEFARGGMIELRPGHQSGQGGGNRPDGKVTGDPAVCVRFRYAVV